MWNYQRVPSLVFTGFLGSNKQLVPGGPPNSSGLLPSWRLLLDWGLVCKVAIDDFPMKKWWFSIGFCRFTRGYLTETCDFPRFCWFNGFVFQGIIVGYGYSGMLIFHRVFVGLPKGSTLKLAQDRDCSKTPRKQWFFGVWQCSIIQGYHPANLNVWGRRTKPSQHKKPWGEPAINQPTNQKRLQMGENRHAHQPTLGNIMVTQWAS